MSTDQKQPHWDTQNKVCWWLLFLFQATDKTSHMILLCFHFLAMAAEPLVTDVHSGDRFWNNASKFPLHLLHPFCSFGMRKAPSS